jgi:hypothetical protein
MVYVPIHYEGRRVATISADGQAPALPMTIAGWRPRIGFRCRWLCQSGPSPLIVRSSSLG